MTRSEIANENLGKLFGISLENNHGCLKAGNSVETILAAIIQVMPYVGFPNGMRALKIAKEIFNF